MFSVASAGWSAPGGTSPYYATERFLPRCYGLQDALDSLSSGLRGKDVERRARIIRIGIFLAEISGDCRVSPRFGARGIMKALTAF